MNIKLTLTTAIVLSGLLAAPAFAQSSATKAEDYKKDKAEKMEDAKTDVKIMSDEMMARPAGTVTAKGDPLTIETPSKVITATEGEVVVSEDGMMLKGKEIMTEPKMEEIDVMTPAPILEKPAMTAAPSASTSVVIACPEGTTAQNDGTCMITGDYEE